MTDLGFIWDILAPSPSGPVAKGKVPMHVQTAIDPDSLDDGLESITITWGDGLETTLDPLDWEIEADHVYTRPGVYSATARSNPAGFSDTKTFIARAMGVNPKERRTRFTRPR